MAFFSRIILQAVAMSKLIANPLLIPHDFEDNVVVSSQGRRQGFGPLDYPLPR